VTEPNTFTGVELDRAADQRRRDPEWVERQRDDPGARAVSASSEGVRVEDSRLALAPLDGGSAVLLGVGADGPVWAVDEDAPVVEGELAPLVGGGERGGGGEGTSASSEPMGLREVAAALPAADAGLAGYASALLNWHRRHSFCANCGAATGVEEAGLARRCPTCGLSHHPRVDPVVIMLVVREGAVLLGRQPRWPAGRFSALAGFVGPGESLEEAVAREVAEEAGVTVAPPRYVSSQPWPFPASLMLGFVAPWAGGEPVRQDDELEEVRWFSRGEVAAAARSADGWQPAPDGTLGLPPRTAIARRLIHGWLAG